MVFIAPFIIKGFHHHCKEYTTISNLPSNKIIAIKERPCPICQFEFVNFILENIEYASIYRTPVYLKNSDLFSQAFNFTFSSFSRRAPPDI